MFVINNRLDLLVVVPICKELNITHRANGFAFKWLDFSDTQWEVIMPNSSILTEIKNHLAGVSLYQREPFTAGSPTHQWIWYYEQAMPNKIRTSSEVCEREFEHRESSSLLPQHFGKKIMQAYIKEQLKKFEGEYVTFRDVSVFIGSWNCAGRDPGERILMWINSARRENDGESYDMMVFSLQEMCELSTKNILGSESSAERWTEFIRQQVNCAFPRTYELVSFI
jgi:hypothetical protein